RYDRREIKSRQYNAERIGNDRFALKRHLNTPVHAYLFKDRRDDRRAGHGNDRTEKEAQFPCPSDQIMSQYSGQRRRYQKPDRNQSEHGARRMTDLADVEHHSAFENNYGDRCFDRDAHHVAQKVGQDYSESGFAKDQSGKQQRARRRDAEPLRKYLRGCADKYYQHERRHHKKNMVVLIQILNEWFQQKWLRWFWMVTILTR